MHLLYNQVVFLNNRLGMNQYTHSQVDFVGVNERFKNHVLLIANTSKSHVITYSKILSISL